MSGVTNVVPAYRLRQEDLEKYLRDKFPDHADFDVKVCLLRYDLLMVQTDKASACARSIQLLCSETFI